MYTAGYVHAKAIKDNKLYKDGFQKQQNPVIDARSQITNKYGYRVCNFEGKSSSSSSGSESHFGDSTMDEMDDEDAVGFGVGGRLGDPENEKRTVVTENHIFVCVKIELIGEFLILQKNLITLHFHCIISELFRPHALSPTCDHSS